jgi:putative membrane protein
MTILLAQSVSLPDHFLGDIVAAFCFGLVAILLVVLGFKVFDWLTPRCHFQEEINKGNVSAGLIISSVILGISYVIAQVLASIIR